MSTQEARGKDMSATVARGQALLDEGNFNEAMAYFWHAGEQYAKSEEWEKAGDCLCKAAYCYELDGRREDAAQDYERAADFYGQGDLQEKAARARQAAHSMRDK